MGKKISRRDACKLITLMSWASQYKKALKQRRKKTPCKPHKFKNPPGAPRVTDIFWQAGFHVEWSPAPVVTGAYDDTPTHFEIWERHEIGQSTGIYTAWAVAMSVPYQGQVPHLQNMGNGVTLVINCFRVRAVNKAGASEFSGEGCTSDTE